MADFDAWLADIIVRYTTYDDVDPNYRENVDAGVLADWLDNG